MGRLMFSFSNKSGLSAVMAVLSAALFVTALPPAAQAEEKTGTFRGDLVVRALPDGRNMELIQPFSFVDPNGKLWAVPSGTIVDGASIPPAFWSFIGGPFEDKYREASVIHDHFCETKTDTWENVHLVFYQGMQAKGVDAIKSKLMYAAVYNFGPRWVEVQQGEAAGGLIAGQPILLTAAKDAIVKFITEQNPSIEDIQALSKKLASVETIAQLESLLLENSNCTPILQDSGDAADIKRTIILCGLSAESKKKAALKNMQTLIENLGRLLRAQRRDLLPAMDAYIREPGPDSWAKVQEWTRNVHGLIKLGIRSTLDVEGADVSTVAPSLDDVFGILSQRAAMMSPILDGKQLTPEELQDWTEKYLVLIGRLEARLKAIEGRVAGAAPQ